MFGLKREKSPLLRSAESLHAWAVRAARARALYETMGVPDTIDGRFELLTLHVLLLLDRLQSTDAAMIDLRQFLFDVYLSDLDGAMREMGVSDLAMGKRMRKLGQAIYGRAKAYDVAFLALPDHGELAALLKRTVLGGMRDASAEALTMYVLERRDALRSCENGALRAGAVDSDAKRVG